MASPTSNTWRDNASRVAAYSARAASVPPAAARAAADQDQCRDPLGVTCRIRHRDRRALRDAEHGRALNTCCIHHRAQIRDEVFERDRRRLPVRQPIAALVVANELAVFDEVADPVAPHRAVPVMLEVVQPVGGLHQGPALADDRIG